MSRCFLRYMLVPKELFSSGIYGCWTMLVFDLDYLTICFQEI